MDPFPRPVARPLTEVVVDTAPVTKLAWQHLPLAAAAVNVEDGVDDAPQVEGTRATGARRDIEQRAQTRPFRIAEVTRIAWALGWG